MKCEKYYALDAAADCLAMLELLERSPNVIGVKLTLTMLEHEGWWPWKEQVFRVDYEPTR